MPFIWFENFTEEWLKTQSLNSKYILRTYAVQQCAYVKIKLFRSMNKRNDENKQINSACAEKSNWIEHVGGEGGDGITIGSNN